MAEDDRPGPRVPSPYKEKVPPIKYIDSKKTAKVKMFDSNKT